MTKAAREPAYRKRLGYHAGLLGGMALLASAALVIADIETGDDIARRHAEDMQASLSQVIPPQYHDNNLLQDTVTIDATIPDYHARVLVYRARKADKVTAVAYQMKGQGYGGVIDLIMGVDRDGKILGVRIISHSETPGLGDKIELKKTSWILSFNGHSLGNPGLARWKVKKDGGIFDQFSGATITPRAVVKTVREGLQLFGKYRAQLLADKTGDNSD